MEKRTRVTLALALFMLLAGAVAGERSAQAQCGGQRGLGGEITCVNTQDCGCWSFCVSEMCAGACSHWFDTYAYGCLFYGCYSAWIWGNCHC